MPSVHEVPAQAGDVHEPWGLAGPSRRFPRRRPPPSPVIRRCPPQPAPPPPDLDQGPSARGDGLNGRSAGTARCRKLVADRSESRPVDDRTERPLGRLHRRPPWRVPCARAGPVTVRPPATSALTPGGRTHTAYRTPFPHGRPGERRTSDQPTAPERRRRAAHREPRRVPGDGRRARGRHRTSCSPPAVVFAHAGDVPGRRDLKTAQLSRRHRPSRPFGRCASWTSPGCRPANVLPLGVLSVRVGGWGMLVGVGVRE